MAVKTKALIALSLVAALLAVGRPAMAGPIIISGMDADDHGFVTQAGNQSGWLFMQTALENIAP
jgi:hypothetical protein